LWSLNGSIAALPPPPTLRITSLRKGKVSVVLTTISLGTFFAQSITIGMILVYVRSCGMQTPDMTLHQVFFLRCLYEGESGDPDSPDVGFLKGPLLMRAFRHMFTAPSSASSDNTSKATSRRRDVATSLGLNGRVTPRSIAYAATQLVFSLNSARDWKTEHAGFHYPSFYNFIVDFFEDADNDDSTNAVNELLQWWNIKIFPATARQAGGAGSRNALRSSQKRLRESLARHNHA